MARFWEKGSDSDSGASQASDEGNDLSDQDFFQPGLDENDEDGQEEITSEMDESPEDAARRKFMIPRYRDNENDDSQEEQAKRVVKGAGNKRWHDVEVASRHIENAMKPNDWVVISNGIPLVPWGSSPQY